MHSASTSPDSTIPSAQFASYLQSGHPFRPDVVLLVFVAIFICYVFVLFISLLHIWLHAFFNAHGP